jgi:hypothetical protein
MLGEVVPFGKYKGQPRRGHGRRYGLLRLSHSPPRPSVNPQFAPGTWPDVRIVPPDRGRYVSNIRLDKALWEVVRQPLLRMARCTAVVQRYPD